MERPHITLAVMAVAIVCAIVAYTRRRRAILLLIALFLFIVGGSHGYLRVAYMRDIEIRERRYATLNSLHMGLEMYCGELRGFPLPSLNMEQSGADLHRNLMVRFQKPDGKMAGPYVGGLPTRTENGTPHIVGATGGRILYAYLNNLFVLIDSGPDGLFGGTLDSNGRYTPGPVDANGDGKTDGEDDLMVTVGRSF